MQASPQTEHLFLKSLKTRRKEEERHLVLEEIVKHYYREIKGALDITC